MQFKWFSIKLYNLSSKDYSLGLVRLTIFRTTQEKNRHTFTMIIIGNRIIHERTSSILLTILLIPFCLCMGKYTQWCRKMSFCRQVLLLLVQTPISTRMTATCNTKTNISVRKFHDIIIKVEKLLVVIRVLSQLIQKCFLGSQKHKRITLRHKTTTLYNA